jgi:hypothetical protein
MKRLMTVSLLALALCACSDISSAFDLNATRNTADQFMGKLAKGDVNGAYEMCDHDALSRDTLDRIANNARYSELFRKYEGLEHGDGGERKPGAEFVDVTLAPAKVLGEKGWQAQFALRKKDEGWKIIAFQIKPE